MIPEFSQDEIKKTIEFFRELAVEIDMNDDYFCIVEHALQEMADRGEGGAT
jgi:hypothetical protein